MIFAMQLTDAARFVVFALAALTRAPLTTGMGAVSVSMTGLNGPVILRTSSLIAIEAQRLVRRICPHCREPYVPTVAERTFFAQATARWNGVIPSAAPGTTSPPSSFDSGSPNPQSARSSPPEIRRC